MADSEDEFGEEIWKENGCYMGLDDGDESEEEEHHVGFVELYHRGLRQQEIWQIAIWISCQLMLAV